VAKKTENNPEKNKGGRPRLGEFKKCQINVWLGENVEKQLKERAEREQRPVSQMARILIERGLKEEDAAN
jgi:hypothetical protein